jgi:pimeloyl-ACP methyl ester carboxylesterase
MPIVTVAGHRTAHVKRVVGAKGSRRRRIALIGGVFVIVSMLGMGGILTVWSPGTPRPFLDAAGRPIAGSIAEKTWVDINGVKQGMVIRGQNAANPVLLVVHGGPGMPDYVLTEEYPPELEDLFTVVWWDQRGAGLSYSPDIPAASMTVEQFISDTLTATDYLRQRFDQDKIYLLGHSWGSFIGIQAVARSPQRFHAYLGMGQMVFQLESEKLAYDYMLATYRRRGDSAMVRDLDVPWIFPAGKGRPVARSVVLPRFWPVGTVHPGRPAERGAASPSAGVLFGGQVRLHLQLRFGPGLLPIYRGSREGVLRVR